MTDDHDGQAPAQPGRDGGGLPRDEVAPPRFGVRDEALAQTETAPGRRPRRRPSRTRRVIAIAASTLGLLVVLAGAFWGWSALASNRYAEAFTSLQTATEQQSEAVAAYDARVRSVSGLAERIRSVTAAPEFSADTSAEAEPLRTAFQGLDAIVQAPAAFEPAPQPEFAEPDGEFRAPWEQLGEAESMQAAAGELDDLTQQIDSSAAAASEAEHDVETAEAAYFTALGTRAQATIDANTQSAKSRQVALTRLIEQTSASASAPARDGALVSAIASAEAAVQASQAAEVEKRADPANAVRVEIEDYARSLSNGVALEFVWAPEVSGLGEGWLSGTAETYDSDGGWSIISLNYGVENQWNDGPDARALVTHEVGHTQVFRDACSALFNGPPFSGDQEMWATAWSISFGFDTDGSGIQAYGRPSDEQIAVAGECR
jgi:hypothetical protein